MVDYTLPNPMNAVVQGLQVGGALNQMQAEKQAAQLARARTVERTNAINSIINKQNPTATDYANLTLQYPELNEQAKQAWDMQSPEVQKNKLGRVSEVYAALEANKPEIAIQLLESDALASGNANDPESRRAAETMMEMIRVSPETAKTTVGLRLAALMGPEKFTETFTKLQGERREAALEPSQLTQAQANARQAAIKADFAESQEAADLAKKGWDIYKLQEDVKISKANTRIAALNAQLAREKNQLEKEKLQQELEKAKRERAEKLRKDTAELTSLQGSIDNSVSTIDRLMSNPELDNIVGAVEGSTFYPSTLIGLVSPFSDADKRADAMADLETIQSQSFLNNLMDAKSSGAAFGSLTEKEGTKLEGYIRSLKTKQSESQFRSNLKEIQRLLNKSRENLAKKYGMPSTIPDTPDVQTTEEDSQSIVDFYLSDEGAAGGVYSGQQGQ